VNLESLDAKGLELCGELCGRALAKAHARSGNRQAIAAWLEAGKVFDQALESFGRRERVRSWTQFIADSVIHQKSQPPSWDEVAQLANSYLGCDAWGPRRGMAIDGPR